MADRFYCFACDQDHRVASEIGRNHRRYGIEGGYDRGGLFSDLREFYVQTKGIDAAFAILGFSEVRVRPHRFGSGWPSEADIALAFRERAKTLHPDAGGDPGEFRKLVWAMELLRRYRPPSG